MELYLTNAKKIKLESLENPNEDEKKILEQYRDLNKAIESDLDVDIKAAELERKQAETSKLKTETRCEVANTAIKGIAAVGAIGVGLYKARGAIGALTKLIKTSFYKEERFSSDERDIAGEIVKSLSTKD
jgi:hypothetical protein